MFEQAVTGTGKSAPKPLQIMVTPPAPELFILCGNDVDTNCQSGRCDKVVYCGLFIFSITRACVATKAAVWREAGGGGVRGEGEYEI